MSLTAKNVHDTLENETDFYWDELEYREIEALWVLGERYDFEVLDSKFGEEGDWHANTYIVFKVGDQTFRKTGYYASHDGQYWDGPLVEVEGHPETVIVWRDK